MVTADLAIEVVPGVWSWNAYDPSVRTKLYSTAVAAADGWVLIDPIHLESQALERVIGRTPVCAVVLTNGNHYRAADWFRKWFSAPVFAHPDAVGEFIDPIDGSLRSERPVGGSLEVIGLPGAGAGEVALYQKDRALHVGDALIHLEETGFTLLPEKYCEDQTRLKAALSQLSGRTIELMTFAHGEPILKDAGVQLRGLLGKL